jgi:hypothetical protein
MQERSRQSTNVVGRRVEAASMATLSGQGDGEAAAMTSDGIGIADPPAVPGRAPVAHRAADYGARPVSTYAARR